MSPTVIIAPKSKFKSKRSALITLVLFHSQFIIHFIAFCLILISAFCRSCIFPAYYFQVYLNLLISPKMIFSVQVLYKTVLSPVSFTVISRIFDFYVENCFAKLIFCLIGKSLPCLFVAGLPSQVTSLDKFLLIQELFCGFQFALIY